MKMHQQSKSKIKPWIKCMRNSDRSVTIAGVSACESMYTWKPST